MESKRHPGRTYYIFLPEWIPQVATFIGSLQEDLKPPFPGSIQMAGALECTQLAAEWGHAGCHILSKAIFTIPSFSPWTFLMLRSCVQKQPTGSSLTLTLCVFPRSGIIQTPTVEQQAAAERAPLPRGQPPQQPLPGAEAWMPTSCIPILIPGRQILPGSSCWQVARVRRLLLFLFFFFGGLFLTLLWRKFAASLLSHNYFHSYALEFQLMIHKFLNKAKDSQLSGAGTSPNETSLINTAFPSYSQASTGSWESWRLSQRMAAAIVFAWCPKVGIAWETQEEVGIASHQWLSIYV